MWALGRREPQKAAPVEPAAPAPADGQGARRRSLAQDLLGRAPLARGVVARLEDAPSTASLRVGVYGRSGEGRTTFLRFVEELALERSWVVAWLDPWSAASPEALGQAFVSDVLARLETAPPPERPSGELAPALASALGDRRLLVLVDDVDRLRPQTVALLLGAAREHLTLPGCHLVLAMDPEAVSRSLARANGGWPDGRSFLEATLDHEFHLRPLSPEDRRRLVEAELTRLGLPSAKVLADGGAVELIPADPGRLQRLLRGLGRLGAVLLRHDAADVAASPLLWLELMRSVAPAETERLLGSPDLLGRLERASSAPGSRRELLEAVAELFPGPTQPGDGEADRTEFLRIVEGLLGRGGRPALRYWAGVARGEVPAVTTSELRGLLAAERGATDMEAWLSRQASAVGTAFPELQRALFAQLVSWRDECLARAVEGELEEDLESGLKQAQGALDCLRWLIAEAGAFREAVLSRAEFSLLLDHLVKWAHLTGHPLERAARDCEREILFAATNDLAPLALDILDELGVWDPARQAATAEGGALVGQVCDILREAVAPQVLERFLERDGISATSPTERHLLFGPSSALYREDGRASFAEAAGAAVSNPVVQRNFLSFLRVLHAAARGGVQGVLREDAERLAADRALIRLAWGAATAGRVQPSHRPKLRQVREALGRRFGSLEDLPAPPWLDQAD